LLLNTQEIVHISLNW